MSFTMGSKTFTARVIITKKIGRKCSTFRQQLCVISQYHTSFFLYDFGRVYQMRNIKFCELLAVHNQLFTPVTPSVYHISQIVSGFVIKGIL